MSMAKINHFSFHAEKTGKFFASFQAWNFVFSQDYDLKRTTVEVKINAFPLAIDMLESILMLFTQEKERVS